MSDHHPVEYSEDPYALGPTQADGAPYVPAGRFDSDGEDNKGGGFERYIAALLRFKWVILLITFAGAAGGVLFTRSMPAQYQAQAMLWIESPRTQSAAQPIRSGELLAAYAWVELLESFSILDPVVWQERLYLNVGSPDGVKATSTLVAKEGFRAGDYKLTVSDDGKGYLLSTHNDIVIERGALGDSIARELGVAWLPPAGSLAPGQVVKFALNPIRAAAQVLGAQIDGRADLDVNFLTISLIGQDPVKTAGTVNAVAEQYVRVTTELKRGKLDELSKLLQEQRDLAAANLTQSEAALEAFRVNTITLPSDRGTPLSPGLQITHTPTYDNFFQLKTEQDRLRQDRDAIARTLEEARTGQLSVFALQSVPSVERAPALQGALDDLLRLQAELRALQQRYTDQNSQVIALAGAIQRLEQESIIPEARRLMTDLATREVELAGIIGSASSELQQIPPRAIEEARLERQVASAERIFTDLQQRYETARLAAISSIPDVRPLDRASVPQWPMDDKAKSRIMMMVFLGSFGLAVMSAILLDRFDPKVRYPDQVSSDMGLPILGAVPFIRAGEPGQSPEEAHHAIEAFREIRMNVMYTHGANGPVAFTISSAEAGDGKSFVASNLALSFAQQGHRTLVIDGDIRRGRLHHFLKGVRTPGLSDLLAERASLTQVIQRTEVPLVSLIGSGTRMHVGPELLGSAAMGQHLKELKRQFDVIIIDTPPLGAGVDPYVLAALTGNLLMIVRTGNTNRAFAEAKLKLLDRLPVRVLGAILNGIPANQRIYRYYSYLPSYGAHEESQAENGKSLATIS